MFRLCKVIPKLFPRRNCLPRRESTLSDYEIQQNTQKIIASTPIPVALYGGRHTVTMMPGSGIGPECLKYVKEVFQKTAAPVDFEIFEIDPNIEDQSNFDYAITSIKRNFVAIKADLESTSSESWVTSRNILFRNALDLYVYVLRCKSFPGVPAKHKEVDIAVIRQNTEGEYSLLEHSVSLPKNEVVQNLKIITRSNSLRVARHAFEYARKNQRKKVTTIHKANIMQESDGLFLRVAREVAKEYPDIKHDDMIIDNCCMQLVSNPKQFDVMLTPNLYGNVVASVICGVTNTQFLVSGRNYSDHHAVFEPGMRFRGSSIAGKNVANPVAMLMASVDMLFHLGHSRCARKIEKAIEDTVAEAKWLTADLGGTASSRELVDGIIERCMK